jgi:hypothetical protein
MLSLLLTLLIVVKVGLLLVEQYLGMLFAVYSFLFKVNARSKAIIANWFSK